MPRAKKTMDELLKNEAMVSEAPSSVEEIESEEMAVPVKKRKFGTFWLVYTIVFSVLTLFVVAGIVFCNRILSDYESARPEYVAEKVFEEYFLTEDCSALVEKSGFVVSKYETPEQFVELWNAKKTEELSLLRVSADNGSETVRYNVRAGETTLAAFELKLSGQVTPFKNPLYELSSIEISLRAKESVRVSAPSESVVFVNGIAVTAEEAVETNLPTFCDGHIPEGVAPLVFTNYTVDGLLQQPTVTAVDKNGMPHTLTYDEAQGMYVADILYDEELMAQMQDHVVKAATTYASFMQQGATRTQALSYLEPGTELYQQTQVVNNYWVSAHSGERFEKLNVGEFYAYDENTFSCRVSFVHVLTGGTTRFDEKGENRENVDITWYFRKVGDKYLIYDRENN